MGWLSIFRLTRSSGSWCWMNDYRDLVRLRSDLLVRFWKASRSMSSTARRVTAEQKSSDNNVTSVVSQTKKMSSQPWTFVLFVNSGCKLVIAWRKRAPQSSKRVKLNLRRVFRRVSHKLHLSPLCKRIAHLMMNCNDLTPKQLHAPWAS